MINTIFYGLKGSTRKKLSSFNFEIKIIDNGLAESQPAAVVVERFKFFGNYAESFLFILILVEGLLLKNSKFCF